MYQVEMKHVDMSLFQRVKSKHTQLEVLMLLDAAGLDEVT